MKRLVPVMIPVTMVLLASAGCTVEPGDVLQIRFPVEPDTTCTYRTTSVLSYSVGFFDPWPLRGIRATRYSLWVNMRNNIAKESNDEPLTSQGAKLDSEVHDILLSGFEVCFYRVDDPTAFDDGLPMTCDQLDSSLLGFVPATGYAVPAGGLEVAGAPMFTSEDLQSDRIFGSSFNPVAIPGAGSFAYDANQDGTAEADGGILFISEYPGDNRSAAWGNFPPNTRSADLMLVVRAVGRVQSGSVVRSNWLTLPVIVCVGCSGIECGTVPILTCDDDSRAFDGSLPDASGACLPFQFGVDCVENDGCP